MGLLPGFTLLFSYLYISILPLAVLSGLLRFCLHLVALMILTPCVPLSNEYVVMSY